jgi:hypothetical protein
MGSISNFSKAVPSLLKPLSVQKASVMWMFKKVGSVDVKFPKAQDPSATREQDAILEIALVNDMEDFDIVDSDEEGKQLMKVCTTTLIFSCSLVFNICYFYPVLLPTRTCCTVSGSCFYTSFC